MGAFDAAKQGLIGTIAAINNASKANFNAAERANSISAQAQATQATFNKAMADSANMYNSAFLKAQQAYNTDAAAQANKINQLNWQQTADYNSAEAAKNREWQEYMSNTAYQRAVKDLRAAGLNPILAAMNGGASMGSGASGSTGSLSAATASSGLQSANSAQIGNYMGQMENTSNTLAIAAAITNGLAGIASAWEGLIPDAKAEVGTLIQNANEGIKESNFGKGVKYMYNNYGLGKLLSLFKKDHPGGRGKSR